MADTLEELRRHIDELIGRLSEEEEPPGVIDDTDQRQAGAGLDNQIEALGHKIEGASDVLAELSDLLEAQSERIETIEHQLGEPDEVAEPAGAAGPGHEVALARSLEAAVQQGLARVEQRLAAIEARLGGFEAAVGDFRERALQRDREIRELEERVMALAEVAMGGGTEADALAPVQPVVAPAVAEAVAARAEPAAAPAVAEAVVARAEPVAAPAVAEAVAAPVVVDDASEPEILDGAAAKRLEELVEREVRMQHEFAPGADPGSESQARRGRPTVMVVDDSADARTVLSIYLSKTGFQVVSASSAEDCLAKLRYHSVDAIVLDAKMPGGSGAHVCELMRSDASYGDRGRVPVIVYTAYPDEFTHSTAKKWGADEYVVKGGDMLPLMSALIRCTDREFPRASQQGPSATL